MKKRDMVATSLILFVFLLGLFVQTVSALSVHYELDKPYYHPGDTGKLLLVCSNDEPSDTAVFGAEMTITGIGGFNWNMTGLPLTGFGPENRQGHLLEKGQTLRIEIYFKIPVDARPSQYEYTFTLSTQQPFTHSDRLWVVAPGEKPPPEPPHPALLALVALPILVIAYPLVRWKSRKAAKLVAVAIVAAIALGVVFGGFFFLYLIFSFLSTFYPLLILLILGVIIFSIVRRRRRRDIRQSTLASPARTVSFACTQCGRDLSTMPTDITVCPYCGEKLARSTCGSCSKDLSQLPADTKDCPYCGASLLRRVSEAPVVTSVEAREKSQLPSRIFLVGLVAIALSLLLMFVSGMGSGPGLWRPLFPELYAIQSLFFITFLLGITVAIVSGLIIGLRRIKKMQAT